MHVQTHLLRALTQTYRRQVCRWSESNAQVNNRVTSTLKVCTQKDVHVLLHQIHIHLSIHHYMFTSHSAPKKRAGACKWWGTLSHGGAVDSVV